MSEVSPISLDVRSAAGDVVGQVQLRPEIFQIQPNVPVMHQVVTAQLAARRAGTHSTKTRAEVRGGGAKPWRQKGTGRARSGSIRAPQWRGGGVAHGPRPRDYSQRTPKRMIRLALHSALSDRAAEGKVAVVDAWAFEVPRTKDALKALEAFGFGARERVLVVLEPDDEGAWKSFRNIGPRIQPISVRELNAYDTLVNDWVLFTSETLGEVPGPIGKRSHAPVPVVEGGVPVEVSSPAPQAPEQAAEVTA